MDSTTVQGDWHSVGSPMKLFVVSRPNWIEGLSTVCSTYSCIEQILIVCADRLFFPVAANPVKLAAFMHATTPDISNQHPVRRIACVSKRFVQLSPYAAPNHEVQPDDAAKPWQST